MNLRLLYGVAYGHPWFGRWGYKFCHGSFGVTEHKYLVAIEILSSIGLDKLVEDFYNMGLDQERKQIKQIVRIYREMSETQLVTIRDLLRFMLTQKSSSPSKKLTSLPPPPLPPPPPPPPLIKPAKQNRPKTPPLKETQNKSSSSNSKYRKFESFAHENSSRWPSRRLEYAAEVIVNALKEHNDGGMSRQEVRDAARLHIGDTGLLDFVIKSINNLIVGDCVVHRAVNPSTRILEFTIHDIDGGDKPYKLDRTVSCPAAITLTPTSTTMTTTASTSTAPSLPPGLDVYTDIVYLYKQVLEGYPATELAGLATRAILDSKHFVKEWPFRDEDDALLRFLCKVVPSCLEMGLELTREIYERPGELVVLQPQATVGELKMAAECALRDTYCVMEGFLVREIEGLEDMDEEQVLFGAVESGVEVYVVGDINEGVVKIIEEEEDEDGKEVELRYEGGSDKWTVDCSCGARDDDGERMVSCDICEVWQHTRCAGIDDSDVVPLLFLCQRCGASIMGEDKYCNMELEYE